jgi:hypothetical protein
LLFYQRLLYDIATKNNVPNSPASSLAFPKQAEVRRLAVATVKAETLPPRPPRMRKLLAQLCRLKGNPFFLKFSINIFFNI